MIREWGICNSDLGRIPWVVRGRVRVRVKVRVRVRVRVRVKVRGRVRGRGRVRDLEGIPWVIVRDS